MRDVQCKDKVEPHPMLRRAAAHTFFVCSSTVHALPTNHSRVLTCARRQRRVAIGVRPAADCSHQSGVRTARCAMADVYEVCTNFGVSLAFNGALYVGAVKAGQHVLTPRALKHALALGVLLGATVGATGWGLCVLLFAVGSGTTRIGRSRKEAAGIAEARGGARAPAQVWGAAGAAAICAAASCIATLVGARTIAAALRLAYVCAVAAKMSDTVASEIGKAYGSGAFLITTLKQVPAGTDGAVSVEGTLAGIVAAAVAAMYAVGTNLCHGVPGAIAVIVAATIATTAESFLGAHWQKRFALSNELVNFLQTTIAALVALVMFWAAAAFGVVL